MARKCEYQLEICNHMKIFNENAFCPYDRCILLNHDLIKTENKGIKTFLDKNYLGGTNAKRKENNCR